MGTPLHETPTQQARRIANHLLSMLPPDTQTRLTTQAHASGITWLGPTPIYHDDNDVLPPAQAARLVHATPADLRHWVASGVLARTGRGYRVRDVIAAQTRIRQRAATRRRQHPAGPATPPPAPAPVPSPTSVP